IDGFLEGQHTADYSHTSVSDATVSMPMGSESKNDWSQAAIIDWTRLAMDYAAGGGQKISAYLPDTLASKCEAA
ncbi:MAG: hypothetical protein AAF317_17835, partial [Pseudomonadota bacterium]